MMETSDMYDDAKMQFVFPYLPRFMQSKLESVRAEAITPLLSKLA